MPAKHIYQGFTKSQGTTGKNKMPKIIADNISIVETKELERFSRIDAEYYHPKYLALHTLYKEGNWSPIGRHLRNCEYGISIAMNTEGNGYGILRMDNLQGGFAFDDDLKYAPITEKEFYKYRLQKDDILFNRVNSEEFVGRTGIYKLSGNHVFASYLVRLQTKENELLPDYLNIFLNTKYGILSIRRMSRRAVNQANVNAQELKAIKILLAPLKFQEEIKNLLEKSHELFDKSKTLYSQAETLLLEELGIKDIDLSHEPCYEVNSADTISANRIDAEYYQPKYERVIEVIKNCKFGWCKLADKITNITDKHDPKKETEKVFRYIELSNINPSIGIIDGYSEFRSKDLPSRARMLIREGDVIISSVEGSIDKVALVDNHHDGCLASTGFFVFRSKENILPEYTLVLCKSVLIQKQLEKLSSGTILTAVPKKLVQNIIIPNTPKEAQTEIANLIRQSHSARRQAKEFLEEAKRKVEEMIEKGSLI